MVCRTVTAFLLKSDPSLHVYNLVNNSRLSKDWRVAVFLIHLVSFFFLPLCERQKRGPMGHTAISACKPPTSRSCRDHMSQVLKQPPHPHQAHSLSSPSRSGSPQPRGNVPSNRSEVTHFPPRRPCHTMPH